MSKKYKVNKNKRSYVFFFFRFWFTFYSPPFLTRYEWFLLSRGYSKFFVLTCFQHFAVNVNYMLIVITNYIDGYYFYYFSVGYYCYIPF